MVKAPAKINILSSTLTGKRFDVSVL